MLSFLPIIKAVKPQPLPAMDKWVVFPCNNRIDAKSVDSSLPTDGARCQACSELWKSNREQAWSVKRPKPCQKTAARDTNPARSLSYNYSPLSGSLEHSRNLPALKSTAMGKFLKSKILFNRRQVFLLTEKTWAVGVVTQLGALTLEGLCSPFLKVLQRSMLLWIWRFLAQSLPHNSHMHVESVTRDLMIQGQAAQFDLLPDSGPWRGGNYHQSNLR